MNSNKTNNTIDAIKEGEYKYGFVTEIETEQSKKGLNTDTIKYISI